MTLGHWPWPTWSEMRCRLLVLQDKIAYLCSVGECDIITSSCKVLTLVQWRTAIFVNDGLQEWMISKSCVSFEKECISSKGSRLLILIYNFAPIVPSNGHKSRFSAPTMFSWSQGRNSLSQLSIIDITHARARVWAPTSRTCQLWLPQQSCQHASTRARRHSVLDWHLARWNSFPASLKCNGANHDQSWFFMIVHEILKDFPIGVHDSS